VISEAFEQTFLEILRTQKMQIFVTITFLHAIC